MRVVSAFRALWFGAATPYRVPETPLTALLAVFAVAVLTMSLADAAAAIVEWRNETLLSQSMLLGPQSGSADSALVRDLPQREFTAALGGSLMENIIASLVMSGFLLVLVRFMTNAAVTFPMALVCVSATALIQVADVGVSSAIHVFTGSIQYGLHAGSFVNPALSPAWFTALQKTSVFSLWQYLSATSALAVWGGLHWRYGLITGAVAWVVTRLLFALFTLISWMVAQLTP